MSDARRMLLVLLIILVALQMAPHRSLLPATFAEPEKLPEPSALIAAAVKQLVQMQEEGGQWPYEGVYRVNREIPVGYRIGGTAIAATALLFAAPTDPAAMSAVDKAQVFILKELGDPLMTPSVENVYDVRIWGQAYALEFLCHVRAAKRAGTHAKAVDEWIAKLIPMLV